MVRIKIRYGQIAHIYIMVYILLVNLECIVEHNIKSNIIADMNIYFYKKVPVFVFVIGCLYPRCPLELHAFSCERLKASW